MSKAYVKIPGHFCFVEQVRRDQDTESERRRLHAMAKQAIDKYFNFSPSGNDRYEYTYTEKS